LTQSGFDCRIGGAIVIIVVFLQRLLWIYTVRKNFLTVGASGIVQILLNTFEYFSLFCKPTSRSTLLLVV